MGSWLKRIAPNVVIRSGLLYGYRSGHHFRKDQHIFQKKDEASVFFDRLFSLSGLFLAILVILQ